MPVEPDGRIFEHGWQSWTPSTTYRIGDQAIRSTDEWARLVHRVDPSGAAPGTYEGQGLLAVEPAPGGPVHVFAAPDAHEDVPTIRAEVRGPRLIVDADGPIAHVEDGGPGGIDGALARWADRFAITMAVPRMRRAPTVWCSWYHYFRDVTADDIAENLVEMDRLRLPVDVVQIDDGYESEVGDWFTNSDRFGDLAPLIARILGAGRRAGLWVAPLIVGARSAIAARHPDWLIGGPGDPLPVKRWSGQLMYGLDVTRPDVRDWLTEVFGGFRAMGIDYFKIDFIYGGAVEGPRASGRSPVAAYRSGIEVIRAAIGDAYLLGCGGPILPSVGLVDAMRVSPDTAPHFEPETGDLSEPGGRSAIVTGVGRAFQQGRFWINDPDCLIVRPAVERRELWADHVERFGGLRASSDRLKDLDQWGVETTRRILSDPPVGPFIPSDAAGDATTRS